MTTKPLIKRGTARAVKLALAGIFLMSSGIASADLATERLILNDFYTKANGSKWLDVSGWDEVHASVCARQGVTCDCEVQGGDIEAAEDLNQDCANEASVVGLSLADRGLSGTLTTEIGGLSNLVHLDLHGNSIGGEIPAEITELTKLEDLQLDRNAFSGELPEGVDGLESLETLKLQRNKLTGNIDQLVALLPANIDVSFNGFYGTGDEITSELDGSQTLDAKVIEVSPEKTSATVTWQPVSYTQSGGYIVEFLDSDGNVVSSATKESKDANYAIVYNLSPGTEYQVVVRSYTNAHPPANENRVESDGLFHEPYVVTTGDTDTDGDGIGDTIEGRYETPQPDSDGDGNPDWNDSDDDNDGVLTKDELPINLDTDGDGVPNYRDDDDDGDGKLTALEIQLADTDIDDDDVQSYLDNDDDGDTILTIDELDEDRDGDNLPNWLDADDDGDGFMTIDELPQTNDEDEDGLTDYLDAYEEGAVLGDTDEVGTVITSRGGGALGGGLALLALAGLGRKNTRRRAAAIAVALVCASTGAVQAADTEDNSVFGKLKHSLKGDASNDGLSNERAGRFYIGASAGLTTLDPEAIDASHTVSDGNDFGAILTLGYEVSNYVALEMFGGTLGGADLDPEATVDYKTFGAGVAINPVGRAYGFIPMLRLGLNKIGNSSSGVNYEREEDYLGYASLGLEYEFDNAFSIRAAYDRYAEDAQMFHLGVFKHFGGAAPAPVIINTPAPAPAPQPVIVRTEIPAPAPIIMPEMPAPILHIPDSDGDGVSDIGDKCPNSPPGAEIDVYGCAKFQGVLRGVNFEYDSAKLTPNAMRILSEVAEELVKFPKVKVELQAHTDSKGTDQYNQRLSQRRAQSVLNFLSRSQVSTSRLLPIGYGERRPIATNDTKAGRAQNRRVEFQVRK